MKIEIISFAVFAEIVLSAPALAAGPTFGHLSDLAACSDLKLSPDVRIADCTALIESGLLRDRISVLETLQNLGAAYLQKRDFVHAIPAFNEAIRLDPQLWEAYANRGHAYELLGKFDMALSDYDHVLGIKPGDVHVLNSRCWIRAELGQQLDAALEDCNKAVQLEPNNAAVLDSRAFVEFRMNDVTRAITDCTAALALAPKQAPSLYVRGLAKLKTGDAAGGNADIAAAKLIDPKIADTYAGYGVKP